MKKIAEWEKHVFILIILSILFFIIGNTGLSLTNPDEVFYMDSAREMVKHNSWLTPYIFDQPQFEKPIFTYWLIRLGFLLFGITAFAGRIFPGIFALLGVISLYMLGLAGFGGRKKAFYSALILGSGALYLGLARTVFTDLIFSVFILFALTAFYRGYSKNKKSSGILLFFVFSALAVLTKGPLGILVPGLVVLMFLLWRKELKFIFCPAAFWGVVLFAVIAAPWYGYMFKNYGNAFIREFWINDHLGRVFTAEHPHNDRWYFYPFSMLGCMFPWSFYVAAGLWSILSKLGKKISPFSLFLVCWLGVVLAIFQPAHSKLISYILPLFPALALIAGDFFAEKVLNHRTGLGRALGWATALALLIIPIAVLLAAAKYPLYFFSGRAVQVLALLGWAISLAALVFVFLNKPEPAFFIQAVLLPAILIVIPLTNIEPYVSSRAVSEYLSQQPIDQSVILCSKAFVRGVRFYTGARVAVFNTVGDNFFSPHPIPFINSGQKLRDLLDSQPITYCVLKKSALDDLQRLAGNNYQISELMLVGNEYVLKVAQR
jgi:4-amino-4-deoxy-L-arabinose transferase-like glycosyltransferase